MYNYLKLKLIMSFKKIKEHMFGGRSQVVRQWIVTPSFAGSNPVVRPKFFSELSLKNFCNYSRSCIWVT
jgi:hypothetical protein